MKGFTAVLLLFVCLFATCTARNIDVDADQFQGLWPVEEPRTVEMRQLKTACYEKTGSHQAYRAYIALMDEVDSCFSKQIDENFVRDYNNLNASTRHDFFPKYRSRLHDFFTCIRKPINALKKCLDDDIIEGRIINALSEVLDLVFENNGEILFQGNGTNNEVCTQNLLGYLMDCDNTITMSTCIIAVPKYGEAQCAVLAKARDCTVRKLKECNGLNLMDMLDGYWRAVLKNSPCESLLAERLEI